MNLFWRSCLVFLSMILPFSALAQEKAPTFTAETKLVNVNVIVTDAKGNPIKGLTKDDFLVTEDSAAQSIATFSFEDWSPAKQGSSAYQLPPLPRNTFTNQPLYTKVDGPVTILLLDALNTPVADQIYARSQVLDYLKKQPSGARTAVFALTNRLEIGRAHV